MRYDVGDRVYVRSLMGSGRFRIVGIDLVWQGCVERPTHYKLKTRAGIIRVPVEDILTEGEAVAEVLKKGSVCGHDLGV